MSTITKKDLENAEYAKKNKSMFSLHLDTLNKTEGITLIDHEFVVQTMTLKSIRILFDDETLAQAYPATFLVLSSFAHGHIQSNLSFSGIPILHDTGKADSTIQHDIKISLSKKMPRQIKWSLCDASGNAIPINTVRFIQIIFELELS